jgi:hypothetical protein
MPRKKKEITDNELTTQLQNTFESERQDQSPQLSSAVEELAQPVTEPQLIERQDPGTIPVTEPLIEACPRNFLAASLQSATKSAETLFTKQAQLSGSQIADKVFDSFEEAFLNRLEQRLEPFVSVLIPQIQETSAELKQSTTARLERRQGAFDRLKQIASLITDECRLLPPVHTVGEFIAWDEIEPGKLIEPKEID